jgi:hypothetical protein
MEASVLCFLEPGYDNKTLFTLKQGNDFLLVQIYMDDIILLALLMCLYQVFRK